MIIEKTFIISLSERLVDRLIPLIDYLKEKNIDYTVVEGIKHSDGKQGLVMTMEKLLTECMYAGYQQICILEDDCLFLVDNPKKEIEKCLSQLPKDFDLCYLGVNLFQDAELFTPNLIKINNGWSTHAIVYSKKGIRKVLEAVRRRKLNHIPFDEIIVKHVQNVGNTYCTYPMLITQKDGYSDIAKKEIEYGKFLTERFKERTAHLKKNLVD